jgi:glutamyl/glutaminyl-tRNA synthetase
LIKFFYEKRGQFEAPTSSVTFFNNTKGVGSMGRLVFRVGMSPTEANKTIGAIRTHLYNYAFAKSESAKGKDSIIIFRIDGTNIGEEGKQKALELFDFYSKVLGFQFDITPYNSYQKLGQSVFQSERKTIYLKYLEKLYDSGIAFKDRNSGIALFDLKSFTEQYTDIIEIEDLLFGKIKFDLKKRRERGSQFFALMRPNETALYPLASVVDDAEFGVTHVVRGRDKISGTELQEAIRIALGFRPKKYLHVPLLLDSEGKRLKGAVTFEDFIKKGIVPKALLSYLISSGYGNPNAIYYSLDDFIQNFDYKKIHKHNEKFDIYILLDLNKRIIREMTPKDYLDSFFLYLEKIQERELREKLEIDSKLCQILVTFRRPPVETLEIVKNILDPSYEVPSQHLYNILEEIFQGFEEKKEIIFPDLKGKEKRRFFDAVRWILLGRETFPDGEEIYNYLKEKKLLDSRMKKAKIAYLQYKQIAQRTEKQY